MRISTLMAAALSTGLLAAPVAVAQAVSTGQTALIYEQPLTAQGIKLVQQKLRETGSYTGETDGLWGSSSQAALQRYQQTHGLQVTGQLNQATLATLGLDPAAVIARGDEATGRSAESRPLTGEGLDRQVVERIQSKLRQLGFYNGEADGAWGANTAGALERFQQSRGLQASGQLNPATVSALGLDPNNLTARIENGVAGSSTRH